MSFILNTYNRKKISFIKGKGTFLHGTNGKKYLDFVQGIAVNCLGHANSYLINAISKQAKKLWHVSNVFTIPEQERLAKRLTQKTFADYVTFQNSGAEATEAAIKFARRYFYSIGKPKKNRVLCINNSFHGRTLATIFASNSKKATEGFAPKVDGFDHFNFGDHKGLEKAITSRTAAIMVETIMGEGGIKVIPDYCLVGLRKLCNKKNILLILDEVQCGIGRSGKFFAFEHAQIKPDIVPIAKGIGGGFPIGAVLVNKKVASGMKPGTHGSTFGGNPLAMSAGNAVMDIIFKKGFLSNVAKNGKYFLKELNNLKKKISKYN
jgi:acetylornithine/N-succinyldiaminopimelate aminotransferase